MAKLRKREQGQALVEFAIVLPILLMVVCGIIDFGWLFYNQLSVQNACREGARFACVNATSETLEADVINKVKENISEGVSGLDVEVTLDYDTEVTDGYVIVKVRGEAEVLTPISGVFVDGMTKGLSASVSMKVEQ